jgi:hypothetical protein
MGYYDYGDHGVAGLRRLVGRTVSEVRMGEYRLSFVTDQGVIAYEVDGDCCSHSYLHDFFGVQNLLENGPITAVDSIELDIDDRPIDEDNGYEFDDEYIQSYGFRLTTVSPNWGPVSSVFSFRNASNGYYGGLIFRIDSTEFTEDQVVLTGDKVGA